MLIAQDAGSFLGSSTKGGFMKQRHEHHHAMSHHSVSVSRVAFSATVHCLTGCAIGEVLGMVVGTFFGWDNTKTILLAVILAFVFGYSLTLYPMLTVGVPFRSALGLGLSLRYAIDRCYGVRGQWDCPCDTRCHGCRSLDWALLGESHIVAGRRLRSRIPCESLAD
jgi:hypothetical protein